MPGYFDPALSAGGGMSAERTNDDESFQIHFEGRVYTRSQWVRVLAELATRWPRPLPPDPDPDNGTIRVFHRNQWMTWEEWERTRPVLIEAEPEQTHAQDIHSRITRRNTS